MVSSLNLKAPRITFIGAGSMAEAIIRGLVEKSIVPSSQIYAVNRSNQESMTQLQARYSIHTCTLLSQPEESAKFIAQADIIILAMKPKDAKNALVPLRNLFSHRQLIISVLAGTSIALLQTVLGMQLPVIRTMPNTSSSIGQGVTGISYSSEVDDTQREIGLSIFQAIGQVCVVEEHLLDIVTGLSGSGPAYVYYFIEALIRGGVEGGLSSESARQLAVQTVLGAAAMVEATGEEPAELRRKVTSPNGTTQAALEFMDLHQFSDTVRGAVLRSKERAIEIGQQLSKEALQ